MTTDNGKPTVIQAARHKRLDDQRKAVVELRERLAERTLWHILENLASNGYGPNNEAAKYLSKYEPRIDEVMSALNAAVSCAAGTYRMRDALAIVGHVFRPASFAKQSQGYKGCSVERMGAFLLNAIWHVEPIFAKTNIPIVDSHADFDKILTPSHVVLTKDGERYAMPDEVRYAGAVVPAGSIPKWAEVGGFGRRENDLLVTNLISKAGHDDLSAYGVELSNWDDLDGSTIACVDHLSAQVWTLNEVGAEFGALAAFSKTEEVRSKVRARVKDARKAERKGRGVSLGDDVETSDVTADIADRMRNDGSTGDLFALRVADEIDPTFRYRYYKIGEPIQPTEIANVDHMRTLSTFSIPYFLDDKGRVYAAGSVTPQEPFGKMILRPADGPAYNRGEALEVAEKYARRARYMGRVCDVEKWTDIARKCVTDASAFSAMTDKLTGVFDLSAWAAFRVLDLAGESGDVLVSRDATCSGGQIAAGMMRDRATAEQTNLTKSDGLRDAYLAILDVMGTDFGLGQKAARDLVKKPSLAALYGGGIKSVRDVVAEHLPELKGAEANDAAKLIHDAVCEVFGSVVVVSEWHREVAEMLEAAGIVQHEWRAPIGKMYAMTAAVDAEGPETEYQIFGDTVRLRPRAYSEEAGGVDYGALARRVHSQIIQGLDALICHRTVANFIGLAGPDAFISTNHDCFTVTKENQGHLVDSFKLAMLTTLSTDWLKKYAVELEFMTEMTLPPLPKKGDWDLAEIWDSEYLLGEPQ